MTRRITALTWKGRELGRFLAELDARGWTVVPEVEAGEVPGLRQLFKDVERCEGWHVRTSYARETSTFSIARSFPR